MSRAFSFCLSVVAGIVLFACTSRAVDISPESRNRQTVPVLVPTVHAVLLEPPVRPADAEILTHSGRNFFTKLRDGISNLFNHTNSHNATASTAETSNSTDATEEGVANSTSTAEATTTPLPGVNDTAIRPKNTTVSTPPPEPFKTTSADAVTPRMRLTSFIESISASLEGMRFALDRAFWSPAKQPYEIKSRNSTMLIAEILGKRFFAPEGSSVAKPVRAVFHNQKLTVEVEEAAFEEIRDKSNKVSEQAAGIGTEYHFVVGNSYVNVEDIYLRPTNGETPGYEVIIPLKANSKNAMNSTAISKISARAMSSHPRIVDGHWGTTHEEDNYEFLQSQIYCQKEHGYSGIRRMLCTCERVHVESETRRLLCVSRVADKVVRVAKEHKENRIATMVYKGSIRCRNARYGLSGSYGCLVRLLQKQSGKKSRLHLKYGRSILSKEATSAEKVDEILANEKVEGRELLGDGEDGGEFAKEKSTMMQMLMFMVYVVGLVFLLVCFFDVSQQYQRHNEGNHSGGHLSRLPEHAQALYARLSMRNE